VTGVNNKIYISRKGKKIVVVSAVKMKKLGILLELNSKTAVTKKIIITFLYRYQKT